jgi:MSHA biogenesis protein MshE
VVLRLLERGGGTIGLDALGLPLDLLRAMERLARKPQGMILVTGPTGSGKTTTLYSALALRAASTEKIITLEDPIEYTLNDVAQVPVHTQTGVTFASMLRSILRQDPDVILVGEMRDRDTVETGLRAAMTGHLVFSTLHTNDAVSTPIRLLDMGAPPYMVAMSLQVVVAQRLLRLICESCGEVTPLLPQQQQWIVQTLGSKARDFQYRKGRGCTQCNGTGYMGRTGVYEMLEMTAPVVEAANKADPAIFIQVAREQMQGQTLKDHAAALVTQGKTTVEEAMRISTQLDD